MFKITQKLLRNPGMVSVLMVVLLAGPVGFGTYVLASGTSQFQQAINAGTLSVDIVDAGYVSVPSPSVAMGAVTFSYDSQTSTGVLGTNSEQIYVQNPDAADNGWTLAIAASNDSDLWTSAASSSVNFDFNNPDGSGFTYGQMTIDASGGTLAAVNCVSCSTDNITKGSSATFEQGTTTSITLLTAASESDDIGRWTLKNVAISQKIPAEQKVASDYAINMVLSVTAS